MATWIEFRCEHRGSGGKTADDRCWSDENCGPMEMAYDDQASILAALRMMSAQAKKEGWVRRKEGWVCPICVKLNR